MEDYTYLIVGGGMTAAAAIAGVREVDADGSIAMIGAEADPPYNRPPLSKGLWKGKPIDKIWRKIDLPGVQTHLGRNVTHIDPTQKQVTDDQGGIYHYHKLLLATGGKPRMLPFGGDHVIYYRTINDYRRLSATAGSGRRTVVIGGGFIGSEIAAALTMAGSQVALVFPAEGIGTRVYPHDLSQFLNGYYREKGIEVLAGEMVSAVDSKADRLVVKTEAGKELVADDVVAGIGISPNVELAQTIGLQVENGIVVNEYLQTSDPDIYAAGDVAAFTNPALGMRMRVEHEDNANTMGKQAGRAMAGQAEPYHHLPYFYSDLFDLGYEAVGELNPKLEVISDWLEPYQKGVIYYLDQGRVRGVLLWNVWDQIEAARALIAEPGPFTPAMLTGRLPD
jgi:3-phenylpropionate/trans-cinnamate dioxygenase ferredoxin reductase component